MEWPEFNIAELANILLAGFIGAIGTWVFTHFSNKREMEKEKKAWEREMLIRERDEIKNQLSALEQSQLISFEELKKLHDGILYYEPEASTDYRKQVEAQLNKLEISEEKKERLRQEAWIELEKLVVGTGRSIIETSHYAKIEALTKSLSDAELELVRFHRDNQ